MPRPEASGTFRAARFPGRQRERAWSESRCSKITGSIGETITRRPVSTGRRSKLFSGVLLAYSGRYVFDAAIHQGTGGKSQVSTRAGPELYPPKSSKALSSGSESIPAEYRLGGTVAGCNCFQSVPFHAQVSSREFSQT